ncbi:MAG: succinate dehydrogenase iron-sulfur subunit [Proteobacteria bacterium]|nr:succinate dehydrogenase iron-sulfur subunit [Pseudomonadota bacterium]NIS68397.1 succinate dehydrogenase iron-sulfur subunit [Pseudomonadota bacterium]
MDRLLTLKVHRFDPHRELTRWTETFQIQPWGRMNLLEALLRIQEEIDGSLSFRYSCRGAVCGSCAMRVNGQVVLACRTPVKNLLGKTTLVEPLPNFPVIRDLIVDMSAFFNHYREIEPSLQGRPLEPLSENRMGEEERKEIDPYINCILCGICYGVCPAFERDVQFLGPAMLAKAYRFLADSRDERFQEILEAVDSQKGLWGCNTVFQCVRICPKEVPPTLGIVKMRRKLLRHRLASLIRRLPSFIFPLL